MEEKERILKAIRRKWLVIVRNPGKPDFPYQGRILREAGNGNFWFKGFSKTEEMEGVIRAGDIIVIDHINGKFCMNCRRSYTVEIRTCPSCEKSAFFLEYDTEEE